jgi:hypothetical protein
MLETWIVRKTPEKVLENTIGNPLNESLKLVVGKIMNFYCNDPIPLIYEPSADQHNNFFWLETWTLITGDLRFLAAILGRKICQTLGAHGACFQRHSGMILHIFQASCGQLKRSVGSTNCNEKWDARNSRKYKVMHR